MELSWNLIVPLATSLAIGLLIGIERGWSDRQEDEGARIAGIRTFSIIGLLGGVWAFLSREMSDWIIAVAFLSVSALVIVAHVLAVREDRDVGTTTAFAMMLTFALSALAVLGHEIAALSVTVITMALLGYKPMLHKWLRNVEQKEVYAGIKLLIITVVLFPLLPNQGYGPWDALNPYWIWWMVVLISGLSFLGYVAIKLAGNRLGILLTAIMGGLASSTAVTLSMAQFAVQSKKKSIFMAGVLFAGSIMFIRVLIEVSVVNAEVLSVIWIPITLMFAGMLVMGGWTLFAERNNKKESGHPLNLTNPFQIGMALKFGLLLAVILILSEGVKEWYGDEGLYILSLASGLMDVDAITLTLSNMANNGTATDVAGTGIIIAAATNTLVKGFIFAFVVGPKASLRLLSYLLLALIPGLLFAVYLL